MPEYPALVSRKIKYNSPSGFVHIGKYVPPFEKNDTGFGFKGVLVEDFKSGKIQCSICGRWFEQMAIHLRTHKIDSAEYKRRFGLLQSTALKTKRLRLIQSAVMIKLRKENPQNRYKFSKNNGEAGNRKGKPKAVESKNKYGVCDKQLIDRILQLHQELGKTPTLIDLKERYGAGMIFLLNNRYGSYTQICRDIGLKPCFSNQNPKYSKKYFIEKGLSKYPCIRILTIPEQRAFYKYFKGGVKEWRKAIKEKQNAKN